MAFGQFGQLHLSDFRCRQQSKVLRGTMSTIIRLVSAWSTIQHRLIDQGENGVLVTERRMR
jgi:hypothetical protein